MAGPSVEQLKARIAQLERQVAELTQRLAAYERNNQPRKENPVDSQTVREKVRFDWQS
jgi:phage shock protein A